LAKKTPSCRCTKALTHGAIAQKIRNSVAQTFDFTWLDKQPFLSLSNRIDHTWNPAGHHSDTERHGFENRNGESLAP
jgi:hypothetical protein